MLQDLANIITIFSLEIRKFSQDVLLVIYVCDCYRWCLKIVCFYMFLKCLNACLQDVSLRLASVYRICALYDVTKKISLSLILVFECHFFSRLWFIVSALHSTCSFLLLQGMFSLSQGSLSLLLLCIFSFGLRAEISELIPLELQHCNGYNERKGPGSQ